MHFVQLEQIIIVNSFPKPRLLSPLRSIGTDNYCKDSFRKPRILSPLRTIGTYNYCKDSFSKPRLLSPLRSIGTDNYCKDSFLNQGYLVHFVQLEQIIIVKIVF